VDPLDGTRDFLKRNGQFTVNIALLQGSQAVLGVVAVPVEVSGGVGGVGWGWRGRVGNRRWGWGG
jgi:3'(2'), 5'-bisphosphate nucleotidase